MCEKENTIPVKQVAGLLESIQHLYIESELYSIVIIDEIIGKSYDEITGTLKGFEFLNDCSGSCFEECPLVREGHSKRNLSGELFRLLVIITNIRTGLQGLNWLLKIAGRMNIVFNYNGFLPYYMLILSVIFTCHICR